MGFSHYMATKKEITPQKWNDEVIPGIRLIIEAARRPPFAHEIVGSHGEPDTHPYFGEDCIRFNGLGEDGYETMEIKRTVDDFYFCKTSRNPYDAVCVAVLIFMETCFRTQFSWRSDGDDEEGFKQEGLAILKAAFDYKILDRKSLMSSLKNKLKQEDPALQGNLTT